MTKKKLFYCFAFDKIGEKEHESHKSAGSAAAFPDILLFWLHVCVRSPVALLVSHTQTWQHAHTGLATARDSRQLVAVPVLETDMLS